jgi:hypothetical protein
VRSRPHLGNCGTLLNRGDPGGPMPRCIFGQLTQLREHPIAQPKPSRTATTPRLMSTTPTLKTLTRSPNTIGVRSLMLIALAFAGLLLLSNLPLISSTLHSYLSAVPLALAGIGYAILQLRAGPPRRTLFKRLLLAATFVIWAVDQLLPAGRLATLIGDMVIAAYVLDLYWITQEQVAGVKSTPDSDHRST